MLPGVGFSELLLIGLAALIFVGPKDLPMLMRRLGEFLAKGRRMAREFQSAFEDIARQSELDELKKEIQALKQSSGMTKAQEDLAAIEADINSAVMRVHPSEPEAALPSPPETPPPVEGKA